MKPIVRAVVFLLAAAILSACNTRQGNAPASGATVAATAPKAKECWRWGTRSDGTRYCELYDAPNY